MKTKQKPARSTSTPTAPTPATPETADTSLSGLSWFTQATIILALIPFVGYLFTLSFEASFCKYFSLPYYLISINPTLVLSMTIGTVGPFTHLIISALLMIVLAPLFGNLSLKNRKRLFITVFVALVFTFCDYLFKQESRKYISLNLLWIIGGITVISYIGIWIFLGFKRDKLWWNQPLTDINNTEKTPISSLSNSRISVLVFSILVFIALCVYGYSYLGTYQSEHQTEFPVFKPSSVDSFKFEAALGPKAAVLRTYGEYVYAVPFNLGTDGAVFEKQLIIVKMSDIKAPLSFEKIGPLKAKPEGESARDQSKK
jgi:hypothetical protein